MSLKEARLLLEEATTREEEFFANIEVRLEQNHHMVEKNTDSKDAFL